ncbi:uncharacterized protein LOC105434509 [Cucumis sativus]|uniref:uncharacterized protein LOC105434509 n=1 Tax=Cucumis sativus TaxID=3659 RepID=UPI0005ECFD1B|nr:uncharacterized protein LOC105434509 [Cucumis sativus]
MPSTSQFDGLAKIVEKIKQNQERMEKSMQDMIGFFKFVEEKMDKKLEERHDKVNNILEDIKRKQPSSSGAQETNEYMGARSFEKHLDKVEEGKEEEDEEEDEAANLNMESINQKDLEKKDDHEDSEGRGGMAESGNQGSGEPVGGQTTLAKP